jgi:hypothetical protein
VSSRSGVSGSWRGGGSGSWGSGSKSCADGPSWRRDSEKESGKKLMGKKGEEEEVTSPMKDI